MSKDKVVLQLPWNTITICQQSCENGSDCHVSGLNKRPMINWLNPKHLRRCVCFFPCATRILQKEALEDWETLSERQVQHKGA